MKEIPVYFAELITKHLAGETSAGEIMELSGWMKADPGNQENFEELRKAWMAFETSRIGENIVVEDEWRKLKTRIENEKAGKLKVKDPGYIKNDQDAVVFPFREGTGTAKVFQWVLRIAAVFLLVAVLTFLVIRHFDGREIKIAALDKLIETSLPDGTHITLNSGSSITYPQHFKGKTRELNLTGEAYFNVRHDGKSKFIISAGKVRIEDIGTSFYVKTGKPGEKTVVVLTEGEAAVYFHDNPSRKVILTPGEKADIAQSENIIEKTLNHDRNYLAWKTRRLEFSDNTLGEVVTLLNKVYGADIRISGNHINNCRLTAIFDNQSLGSVFNVIQSTLDVAIRPQGTHYEISGRKCD